MRSRNKRVLLGKAEREQTEECFGTRFGKNQDLHRRKEYGCLEQEENSFN